MFRRMLVLVAAIGLVAAACADDDSTTTTVTVAPSPTTTASATTTAVTPATDAVAPVAFESDISAFIAAYGEVGDCINIAYDGDEFDYAAGVEHVSCEEGHDHEVFYVGELDAALGEPFPGEDAVASSVFDDVCVDEFSAVYGPWDSTFTMALWATYPLEAEWEAGIRTFKCSATSSLNFEDGTQLLGPAASAGLTLLGQSIGVVAEFEGRDLLLFDFGDDGSLVELTNLTDDGNDGVEDVGIIAWSPDGSTIAYAALDPDAAGEQWDLWLIDMESGVRTQLNDDAPTDSSPVFSPDGSRLLFTSRDRVQPERDIWVMDVDGGNLVQLTDAPGAESSAHWSPDGSQIVYRSNADGSNDVWVMNADGSGQEKLVDLGGDEYDPRWSPLGDRIAFISDSTGDFDIWVVGIDGQGALNLTDHPGDDEYPSWTLDGQFIMFNSDRRGVTSLWVMRADGSDQSDLTMDFPTGWGAVRP